MHDPYKPWPDPAAGVLEMLGPALAHEPPQRPLALDSPHSGSDFPPDFGAAVAEADLRELEDSFVDRLWAPAAERGVPLLAARFPRTYLDVNRHADDIDPELLDGPWPGAPAPSGKAALGKALVWRLLDDGRPIYARRLSVAEVQARIARCHRPYHAALQAMLDATHRHFGVVLHLNCHSMNPVAGAMGVGGAGATRADIVLGDRDGTSCDPALTAFVRDYFTACGHQVAVNDPFKGVELVRAYSDPAAGRHSLQIELNKRLYMDLATRQPHDGFELLQGQLMALLDALDERLAVHRPAVAAGR